MRILLFASALAILTATQASAALVLQNGSFETPDDVAGFTQIPINTTVGDWEASFNQATITDELFNATAPAAVDGSQYIQLNSVNGGRISQFLGITDAPLTDITLAASFAARDFAFTGDRTYSFGLYTDNLGLVPLAEVTGVSTGTLPSNFVGNSVTASGVALGTSVYAFFTADASAAQELFFIDNVTLTTVIPEPSSLLFGLGVLGLGAIRRRR